MAVPALMIIHYAGFSTDEDGDGENEHQLLCDLWIPTSFKRMSGDAPGLDSNRISLSGFIQIATYLNLHPIKYSFKCLYTDLQPLSRPGPIKKWGRFYFYPLLQRLLRQTYTTLQLLRHFAFLSEEAPKGEYFPNDYPSYVQREPTYPYCCFINLCLHAWNSTVYHSSEGSFY